MIAIKDMEMPKCCSQCPLCIEDKYADMTCVLLCEEWEESNYNENHRDENCPLAEIVTCKECKRNGTMKCKCVMYGGHQYMSYQYPNFFCGDGERKK